MTKVLGVSFNRPVTSVLGETLSAGDLPFTGSDVERLIALALLVIGGGVLGIAAGRKKSTG
ncbi:MAG TPA: hypothetical protein VNG13_15830 [Mycobacteriales bacterium]|nr:hypothetical protein [Mycobacteriales bacterium]